MGNDDAARNRQSLTGPAADALGGEERIEDSVANAFRDPAAGVRDRNQDMVAVQSTAHGDDALAIGPRDGIGEGMCGVDHDVEDDLVDLAAVAANRRELAEVGLDVGHVPPLGGRDGQRVSQILVQVDVTRIVAARVRKVLHRTDDRRDAAHSIQRPLERARDGLAQVVEISGLFGGANG